MSDYTRMLLTYGIASAKAGEVSEAAHYLERVLIAPDSTEEQKIRAMEWLAQVTEDPQKKRGYLEDLILHEPGNPIARRGLAVLNGDLNPDDIIDSTHNPAAAAPNPAAGNVETAMVDPNQPLAETIKTKRFICRQCGGTMAFNPETNALTCAYCDRQLSLFQAIDEGAMVTEHDFTVALATAKGHTAPTTLKTFTCQGCAAPFILGAAVLSLTCPYCGSPHVVQDNQSRQLITPEGVIPFAVTLPQAKQALYTWLKKKKLFDKCQVAAPAGLYLPVWTFDIAGMVKAQINIYQHNSNTHHIKTSNQTIEHPVFYNDIPVCASHRLPARLSEEIQHFRLTEVVPYNPGYLADWPADTYQITAADASLVARAYAAHDVQTVVADQIKSRFMQNTDDISVSSSGLFVDGFKLILLPLWITRYRVETTIYTAVINGQTAAVRADAPAGKLKRWFKKLLEDT